MSLNWYVLYTKPNAEYQVAYHLQNADVTVFFPTVRSVKPRPGYTSVPLFPSYLFFRVDMSTFDMSLIRWTPGLRYIVMFDNKPAAVPDAVINYLMHKIEEINSVGGLPSHPFKPGDKLRIRSGPMAGLEAIFEGPMGPAERVKVLVEFLGRVTRAEVPVELLELADGSELVRVLEAPPRRKRRRRTRGKGRVIKHKN